MKTFTMRYPGDPHVEIIEMTREEFLAAFPDRKLVLVGYDDQGNETNRQEYPLGDDVVCDLCNAEITGTLYLGYRGSRAHCPACAAQGWRPWCQEVVK